MGLFDKIKNAFKSNEEENEEKKQPIQSEDILEEETPLLQSDGYNFTYLDNLIYSGDKYVKLEHDIILDENELEHFTSSITNGIYIGVDDITIDGNGHIINAQRKSRIFNIQANNITIKNLTLTNGYLDGCGGAIHIDEFTVENKRPKVSIDNVEFINNYGKNGGAIHSFGDLTISNCTFQDNVSNEGGAIQAWGKCQLKNSKLNNNKSGCGGAIINYGQISINNSILTSNRADEGGAIDNNKILDIINTEIYKNDAREGGVLKNHLGTVTINNSSIKSNTSSKSNILYNDSGIMKIRQSLISENKSKNNILYNNDTLHISDSNLTYNNAENIIFNEFKLSLSGDKVLDNISKNSVLYNKGDLCNVSRTKFENENINILNDGTLNLDNIKVNNTESIVNNGRVTIKNESDKQIVADGLFIERPVLTDGLSKDPIHPQSKSLSFSFLEDLIRNNHENQIILDDDYILFKDELDYFEGGIEISEDNLMIDGQGHVIDGANISRIFIITGKNITLKNIIFKNGLAVHSYDNLSNNYGGVIRNNSKSILHIKNCKFTDNTSESSGGTIDNHGNLSIDECLFSNNSSSGEHFETGGGGAIYNHNNLEINNSIFTNNKYNGKQSFTGGGAIFNDFGNIVVKNSSFDENISNEFGAAVTNDRGYVTFTGCSFSRNNVKSNDYNDGGGGVIFNVETTATFNACQLLENNADNGGAIVNWGKMNIEDTIISNNHACHKGGSILNLGQGLFVNNSTFENNNSEKDNKSITNDSEGEIEITNTTFKEKSKDIDEIISTSDEGKVVVDNCVIK